MAEQSYPFDAGAGAAVNEAQWQAMARRFLATGVIDDSLNELVVSADGSTLGVSVATGDAFVEGFFYRNDAAKALTIATANATNPRIDTVVVRLDRTANSAALAVITGTAAASPTAAALTQTDSLYELPLADVTVPAAAGVIVAGNVTDRRVFSKNLTERDASAAYEPIQNDVYVPASRMNAVGGAPTPGTLAFRHPVWLLDPATEENVAGGWDVPEGWASVYIDLLWTQPGTAGTADVRWQAVLEHADDGGSLNVSGPFASQTAAAPGQYVLKRTRMGAGAAVAVTPGGWNTVRVKRIGADAADTFTEDVALLGVRLVKAS
jgi:hypothetical protein